MNGRGKNAAENTPLVMPATSAGMTDERIERGTLERKRE